MKKITLYFAIIIVFFGACKKQVPNNYFSPKPVFSNIKQNYDFNNLPENRKKLVKIFVEISKYIDTIYFYEIYPDYKIVLDTLKNQKLLKEYRINYGPWNKFTEKPFLNVGKKSQGVNFYPQGFTRQDFMNFADSCKYSPYTFLRYNKKNQLVCVPYHKELKKYIDKISKLLIQASELSDNQEFSKYLHQRAIDLQTDNYYKSDSIWINIRNNDIDFIVGPVYVEDDKLMNLKKSHQAIVLFIDKDWTKRMEKYNKWLRYLQKAIPVPEQYRREEPGTNSNIIVADAVYFGGMGHSGGTLLSETLPTDPQIRLSQGVKNIQFKNIIKFKFEKIILPISQNTINDEQLQYITPEAFFINTLLFEMASSLGIRQTINGNGSVRRSFKNYYEVSEYIKNYSLSLFLAEKLADVGEIKFDLKNCYYTFVVDLLRVVRFGLDDDYGYANIVVFNYLLHNKAIKITDQKININYDKMKKSLSELLKKVIIMQGNGDVKDFEKFVKQYEKLSYKTSEILNKLNEENIPVDINIVQ